MNRLVAGIIAFVVVAAIVIAAVFFLFLRDDEMDDGASMAAVVVETPTVRADAVVVPLRSASLSMSRGGTVTDVLVSENDMVEEGQLLVMLDTTDAEIALQRAADAVASARAEVETLKISIAKERELDDETRPGRLEQARHTLQRAEERYLHLSGANLRAGASVSAEGALLEARYTEARAKAELGVQQAEDALLKAMGVSSADGIKGDAESRARIAERDARIAAAQLSIVDLQNALDDAEDIDKIVQDAQDAVTVATVLLTNAERDLEVTVVDAAEANRLANEAYSDAEFLWRGVHQHYMGIDLTAAELHKDPDTLFAEWGADFEKIFDRDHLSFPNDELQDDPATRWDELKLFGRLGLSPFNAHLTTCREVNKLPSGVRCIRQEYDDAWEGFADARASYITAETNGVSAVQAAESKVLTAQNRLEDAERALEIAQSGRPQASAVSIQSELDAANAALEALLDFSDEAEVAQAKANLEVALATLEDLHHDDHDIALAQQQMEDAQLAVEKLEAGRDPLDEERREARITAAETRVTVAETALQSAQLALADMELRAPFSGVIVAPNVDAGEEVAPRQFVMSIADASEWELVTIDLDELSVIHLSEGDSVRINFDALPDLEMNGTVMRISHFGEEVQGAVTYSADIRMSGSDPRLRWGMTASISK